MIDKWFRTIQLKLSLDEFHQLPRNPAYKYEYFDGQAWLTPRPKGYHAVLDVATFDFSDIGLEQHLASIRPISEMHWESLPAVFAAAFAQMCPFFSLSDAERLVAARDCLEFTRQGGNGVILPSASLVAVDEHDDNIQGALIVTLVPDLPTGDPRFGCVARKLPMESTKFVPHLTWIFINPWCARQGIGSALLVEVVAALRRLGYSRLGTTLLLGNESSTMWHWRMGFALASYPFSMRRINQGLTKEVENDPISDLTAAADSACDFWKNELDNQHGNTAKAK